MNSDQTRTRITRALLLHAPKTAGAAIALRGAVHDAITSPGRLVRATLVLEAAAAHGVPALRAEQLACAVEYWHLGSLLLDDLPCMDDAQERRGHVCAHRLYGESAAILAALAFINRAYALVGAAFASKSKAVRSRAISLVDRVLGPAGLVGGQAHDLAFADSAQSPREISRIAWQKTGTLLWLCVALPSLWSGGLRHERRELRRVCVYWGLAYQAIDDLRDVLGSAADTGKTAQRDFALARPNLAVALGLTAAQRRVRRLLSLAGQTVKCLASRHPRYRFLAAWHEQVFVARELSLRAA